MKRFAAMHDWPVLIVRALTPVSTAASQIRARHDDERIAAAQFENAFLDLARGGAGDFAARRARCRSASPLSRADRRSDVRVWSVSMSNV